MKNELTYDIFHEGIELLLKDYINKYEDKITHKPICYSREDIIEIQLYPRYFKGLSDDKNDLMIEDLIERKRSRLIDINYEDDLLDVSKKASKRNSYKGPSYDDIISRIEKLNKVGFGEYSIETTVKDFGDIKALEFIIKMDYEAFILANGYNQESQAIILREALHLLKTK